jgi:hypothetical protein
MLAIKSYAFGYDIDNIKQVEKHVWKNYAPDQINMHVAFGDDVMNHMTIYRGPDLELDQLIDSCDGAGAFEE